MHHSAVGVTAQRVCRSASIRSCLASLLYHSGVRTSRPTTPASAARSRCTKGASAIHRWLPLIQLLVAVAAYLIIAGVWLAADRRVELRFHQDRRSLNFNSPLA